MRGGLIISFLVLVMDKSRKVIRLQMLQMTSLIMSRMMTQAEMMSPDPRTPRDIAHHVGPDSGDSRRRPVLNPPDGFDISTAERQDDGQFCVFKKLSIEGKLLKMNTVYGVFSHNKILHNIYSHIREAFIR